MLYHFYPHIQFSSQTVMAASSRIYPIALTLAFIFFITFLIPSVGAVESGDSERWLQQSKMVLGSRPPRCVNKCLSCRPCMAALVIPSHQWNKFKAANHGDGDDNYYLLSWKCKCGDKLFQP